MNTDKLIESIFVGDAKPKYFYDWALPQILAGQNTEHLNILTGIASEKNSSQDELIHYFKLALADMGVSFPKTSKKQYMEDRFKDAFENLIFSITEEELLYIANADHGQDIERHYDALKHLIFDRKGLYSEELYWYPYECVELCRWGGKIGHDREFAISNCIVAQSIIVGADTNNDASFMLKELVTKYNALPEDLRIHVIEHVSFAARSQE